MSSDERTSGGGTGGGSGMDSHGNNIQSCSSTYQIGGNQVVLVSRKPVPLNPALHRTEGPSRITILAGGGMPTFVDDGLVEVRGAKGVRVTAGPGDPMILGGTSPPTTTGSTDGVEIVVAQGQKITIQSGFKLPPASPHSFQKIEVTPEGTTLQSGSYPTSFSTISLKPDSVTVECDPGTGPDGPKIEMVGGPQGWNTGSITLSVGGSAIVVDSSGVTITGKKITLSCGVPITWGSSPNPSSAVLDQQGVAIKGGIIQLN